MAKCARWTDAMVRRLPIPLIAGLGMAGLACAEPIPQDPAVFHPYSRTAEAITGPIVLSVDRMAFETGSALDLELIHADATGAWGVSGDVPLAQVFGVSGMPGALRNGNTLCGETEVTYMAAWDEAASGERLLGMAMFTGPTPPAGASGPDLCAMFFFVAPAPG